MSGILVALLGSRGGRPPGVVLGGYDVSFPVLQIALFMAVATAALPYLARGVQRLVEIFITLVALASAVGGHGLPLNVVGSLAIGWGAATTVSAGLRLAARPAVGRRRAAAPGRAGYRRQRECTRSAGRSGGWRSTRPTKARPDGSPGQRLGIEVYGRDAADAKLLTKVGRFLLYRDSGPSLTITRLQQVEREAYLTLRAGRAGAAVPELVEAGTAGRPRTRCWSAACPQAGAGGCRPR